MKPTISEEKRLILMELINKLDDGLLDILHNIEDDETVPDGAYHYFETEAAKLFTVITDLKEEIYYS